MEKDLITEKDLIMEKDFRIDEREKNYFLYKNYTCLRGKTGFKIPLIIFIRCTKKF